MTKHSPPTTVFVAGATGATGRLLVRELLDRGCAVRAVVRSTERVPRELRDHERLELREASLLDLSDAELGELLRDCGAACSCLGHNLTFRGVFLPPRRLVQQAVQRICRIARSQARSSPFRFVLMGSAGVRNRDLPEPVSMAQRTVLMLLRLLVPPHADNERAADALRVGIGPEAPDLEWVVVRPDALYDATELEPYQLHPSPTRSAIFDSGKTSRLQVAHVMAELAAGGGDAALWRDWKGLMPVLYRSEAT